MQTFMFGSADLAGRKSVFDATDVVSDQFRQCPCCRAPVAPLSGTTSMYVTGAKILPVPPLLAPNVAETPNFDFSGRFVRAVLHFWSFLQRPLVLGRRREFTQAEISRLPTGPFGPDANDRIWTSSMPTHMLAAGARGEMTTSVRRKLF